MGTEENSKKSRDHVGSIRSIFMHADRVDWLLMVLGFIGSIGDGFSTPLVLFVTSKLMNNLGGTSSSAEAFTHSINKVLFFHFSFSWFFFSLFVIQTYPRLMTFNYETCGYILTERAGALLPGLWTMGCFFPR